MAAYLAKLNCGFYYGLLGIDEQTIFKKIGRNISEYKEVVEIKNVTSQEIHRVMAAIKYDNPEFFYWSLERTIYVGNQLRLGYWTRNEMEAREKLSALWEERKRILALCRKPGKSSSTDMLSAIYHYLWTHTEYGYEELQVPGTCRWVYELDGVLLKHRAVCLGIAQAVNFLCEGLYIPAILITGEADFDGFTVNHGWNLVKTTPDGAYRHVDLTADICAGTEYKHFLCTDEEMQGYKWSKSTYPMV